MADATMINKIKDCSLNVKADSYLCKNRRSDSFLEMYANELYAYLPLNSQGFSSAVACVSFFIIEIMGI